MLIVSCVPPRFTHGHPPSSTSPRHRPWKASKMIFVMPLPLPGLGERARSTMRPHGQSLALLSSASPPGMAFASSVSEEAGGAASLLPLGWVRPPAGGARSDCRERQATGWRTRPTPRTGPTRPPTRVAQPREILPSVLKTEWYQLRPVIYPARSKHQYRSYRLSSVHSIGTKGVLQNL